MTPIGRLIRNLCERIAERYYEGPTPPQRYSEQVVAFAKAHPGATVDAWAQFATNMARNAYRAGFTRGFEWSERDLDRLRFDDPERIADAQASDWTWHAPEALTSNELAEAVTGSLLERLPDDTAKAKYLDLIGRYYGGFRVVVVRGGS